MTARRLASGNRKAITSPSSSIATSTFSSIDFGSVLERVGGVVEIVDAAGRESG